MLSLPLSTARLTLRDFVPDDFDAIHAYASRPDVTRYMFHGVRTVDDTREYLKRMIDAQADEPRFIWELAIVQRSDDRLIGACDLSLESTDEGDLGFILAKDVWGRGYATEAARAMVHAGFVDLGLERIYATCDVANGASARVLEKAGLRKEAMLEDHKHANGRWWTSFLYGISREQFRMSSAATSAPFNAR
jgi:ribosomal-protein-alanine N-acetyltransferase